VGDLFFFVADGSLNLHSLLLYFLNFSFFKLSLGRIRVLVDALLALSVQFLEVGGLVLVTDFVLVSSDSGLLGLFIFG